MTKGGVGLVSEGSKRVPRRKLSKQVVSSLEELILAGKLRPGDLLPPEGELCEQFGVSRTVIRESIRTLEARGLVHIRHGVGTQVTAGGRGGFSAALLLALRRSNCTMGDLLDFRKLIEPDLASTAAQRATSRDIAAMEEALEAYVQALESGDRARLQEPHLAFHRAVLRATHNPVVEALIDPLTEMILLSNLPAGVLPAKSSGELQDIDAHRDIFACIKAGDSLGARRAMLTDLTNVSVAVNWSTPIQLGDGDQEAGDHAERGLDDGVLA